MGPAARRPDFTGMLVGILVLYAVIIGFGSSAVAGPVRVGLIWFLLWRAAHNRPEVMLRRIAAAVGAFALVATTIATIYGNNRLTETIVGGASAVLITVAGAAMTYTIVERPTIDAASVLGALCIYLLFALFFASLNQLLGTYITGYLNGTSDPATPADLLYFSVITLATVGFGDITPASEVARAVTVVEALVGQLYLVSVVAGVVATWRAGPPA